MKVNKVNLTQSIHIKVCHILNVKANNLYTKKIFSLIFFA